jgi:translation elongation factor EF-Tu-like GTPase
MSFNPDKTEIMLFKNVENSINSYFYFDGKLIPLTSAHKHLGITSSEEAKWNKHVENLIKSVSKHLETPQLSQTSHAYSNIGRM